jgi:hypothetical protein
LTFAIWKKRSSLQYISDAVVVTNKIQYEVLDALKDTSCEDVTQEVERMVYSGNQAAFGDGKMR